MKRRCCDKCSNVMRRVNATWIIDGAASAATVGKSRFEFNKVELR